MLLANAVGAADVTADIVGWFDDGNQPGALYRGQQPFRILDDARAKQIACYTSEMPSETPRS